MFLKNCTYQPTLAELETIGGFNLISDYMLNKTNLASSKEECGEDGTFNWDKANDVMLANLHLLIMALEVRKDTLNDRLNLTELYEKYKINCIRKHLACIDFDIDILLSFYGVRPGDSTGINYMKIDGDDPIVFKIS